jgi:hypothetical protein
VRLDEGLVLLLLKVVDVSLESVVTVQWKRSQKILTHGFIGEYNTHAMYSSHHSTWALNLREELDDRESTRTEIESHKQNT